MGEVFSARDEQLGRVVAVKFLTTSLASRDETRRQLEREARAICSLTHPHVCTLHDLAWDGDVPFLVMEHLSGETLGDRLSRGSVPFSEFVPLALQMIDGLAHAHQAGIVHRDFKPANVMLTSHGVKIFDFGIAKQLPSSLSAIGSATVTAEAAIVGSAPYMSPEQAEGKAIDARSDIFSLGCVFYEMLTGRRAFVGDSAIACLGAVLHRAPTPIDSIDPTIAAPVSALVGRCLNKRVDDRWQTLTDLRRAVVAVTSPTATAVSPSPGPSARVSPLATLLKHASHRYAVLSEIVAAVAVCTLVVLYMTSASLEATDSVMVLPFTNVQNDTNVEYLADGLSESLTNTLSHLRTVRVIARTTAFAYKGREIDVRTLGRELNVRIIISGSVSRANGRLRVQADVVDASGGTQLWGKQYEGRTEDILQIQEDVARNVGERLRLDVSDADRRQLTRAPTSSPEAYDLYLRGRHALSRATVADAQKGIEYFRKALEIDPAYAGAYTGLADSYLGLSGMYLVPKDAMAKARAAAGRAIELDPTSPEAHVSMGVTQLYYDYAWRESEEQFKRAIELNPFEPSVRLWYGWNLVARGQQRAGIAQAQRAHELDPLSAFVETGLGQMYYFAGQPEVAVQRLRSLIASDSSFFNGHYYLGVAHMYASQYTDAIRELEHATRLDPQQFQPVGFLAHAYAKNGDTRSAELRLAELKKAQESRYISGYVFAVAFLGMGANDEAIASLERAYEERDDMLTLIKVDQLFDGLRSDGRFIELLKRMGLD
ncbi:MAG: tetratricopeptide repeat-containing serine/threonine-protein kinase [Chloroflexota bacterium]|nr:tetratricopeptide repeat-containing serine/threonine-protein kinase [Chloroflexota bacterium]